MSRQTSDVTGGYISVQLDADRRLTTPSGILKNFIRPDQIIIDDMGGILIETNIHPHLCPTSQLAIYLECYRQNPDRLKFRSSPSTNGGRDYCKNMYFQQNRVPEIVLVM